LYRYVQLTVELYILQQVEDKEAIFEPVTVMMAGVEPEYDVTSGIFTIVIFMLL